MTKVKKPNVIDLFCGSGGLSKGFEMAGFHISYLNDINKAALMTAVRNHNAPSYLGGIEFLSKEHIESALGDEKPLIHGIIGGPPCQGFSMANQQSRFIDNPKNHLFRHYIRLVWEIKPYFFVMENVEGLLNMANGRIIDEIINSFKDIGYSVDYNTLLSADYGVPQYRKRVVLIGNRIDKRNAFPNKRNTEKNYISVLDAISDLPEIPSGHIKDEIDYTKPPKNDYQKISRKFSSKVFNHITTKHSKKVLDRLCHIPQGGNWKNIPLELLDDYTDVSRTHSSVYKRLNPNAPSITISNFRKSMILHPNQNRIISVREAARIQSFPDDYYFCGTINEQQQQVADAVPPLMGNAIAESVMNYILE
ncbi:MAG: DNA cytosine methyltransferase [Spirochaetes bacterium]|nr:DNA cytosine methyltransferase [Spirochaetota bacterium]